MNIQERVLTALKPVVASKGFGEKTVEGLATNLASGLSDESTDEDITTAINGASTYLNLMQSENTRYINEYKKKNPTPAPSPANPTPANPEQKADEPTGLEAKFLELTGKFEQLLAQNNALSLKQKWQKLAEANGIVNETLIQKWQPAKEDDFDSAIEELKNFNTSFIKQSANDKSPGKPNSGDRSDGDHNKPKALSAKGKEALEGFKKAQERHAKKA